jgi:hypothetical protein
MVLRGRHWRQTRDGRHLAPSRGARDLTKLCQCSSGPQARSSGERDNRLLLGQPYKSAGEFIDGVFLLAAAGFAAGQ